MPSGGMMEGELRKPSRMLEIFHILIWIVVKWVGFIYTSHIKIWAFYHI